MALVDARLFDSRAKAQEAIAAGLVRVDGTVMRRSSARIVPAARLDAEAPYPWVSRGGLKLAAALETFEVDPAGRTCLDVGASTGGFTDVLLFRGARRVHAVDVGHGQLHETLRRDPRVEDLPGTDARDLGPGRFDPAPDLIVCDASFISLTLVLPAVLALAAPRSDLLALIKPQFEVGKGRTRKGIVRDADLRRRACERVTSVIADHGWTVRGLVPSPVTGGDGNVEFLVAAARP